MIPVSQKVKSKPECSNLILWSIVCFAFNYWLVQSDDSLQYVRRWFVTICFYNAKKNWTIEWQLKLARILVIGNILQIILNYGKILRKTECCCRPTFQSKTWTRVNMPWIAIHQVDTNCTVLHIIPVRRIVVIIEHFVCLQDH